GSTAGRRSAPPTRRPVGRPTWQIACCLAPPRVGPARFAPPPPAGLAYEPADGHGQDFPPAARPDARSLNEDVGTGPAVQGVGARAAGEDVVPGPAEEVVIPRAA